MARPCSALEVSGGVDNVAPDSAFFTGGEGCMAAICSLSKYMARARKSMFEVDMLGELA